MTSEIKPIMVHRLRKTPYRFSWLDQRLVREGRLQSLSSEAAALYLFLTCVADAQGMSFYSDNAINQRLQVKSLVSARRELISADLLAYERPYYQVLSLERAAVPEPLKRPLTKAQSASSGDRKMEPTELKDALDELMGSLRK